MTDRERLTSWLATLDRGGFIALPPSPSRFSQSMGHEDAADVARRRGMTEPNYVFWVVDSETAFDRRGALVGELLLYWGGDHAAVAAALASCPAPLQLIDYGSRGAFGVRIPAVRGPGMGEPAEIGRRLHQIGDELRESREQALQWLHAVVASPHAEFRLAALDALADEALASELEAFAAALLSNIEATDTTDPLAAVDKLQRVLERLRGTPHYDAVMATLEPERAQLCQALRLGLLGAEPWSARQEALLRAHLDTPFLAVGSRAARNLVRSLGGRDGRSKEAVALELADDATLSAEARKEMFRRACSQRGYRVKGFLALAEDAALAPAVRSRALTGACGFLRYRYKPEALARVDALVAAGIEADEDALAALRRA